VNYWLLKRWGRLHLMVLTVPLLAGVVTAALFAYAVVSDGFGTTVRARSFTALDQRTDEAATWTWVSYYSGVAPGLTMPADVVLYPVIPGWSRYSVDSAVGTKRDLAWHESEADLKSGWLRARTPTQYLTIRSRNSPHELQFAAPPGKLRITNKLGADIDYLVVIDEQEKVWTGEKIDLNAVTFLRPTERDEAARQLRRLVSENAPEAPEALAGGNTYYRQYQMNRGRYGQYYVEQTLADNLASDALAEITGIDGTSGLELAPRSYVAVTKTGPEVELGVRGADEQDSFHVVVGQW
jgi:hypothetical protein